MASLSPTVHPSWQRVCRCLPRPILANPWVCVCYGVLLPSHHTRSLTHAHAGPQHSNLTMVAYPGETPVVSGGVDLKVGHDLGERHACLCCVGVKYIDLVSLTIDTQVDWKAFKTSGACAGGSTCNIYVADLSGQVTDVPGLQLNGARATRARYPNVPGGIENSCGYGCMIASNNGKWTPPDPNRFGPVKFHTDSDPSHDRNVTAEGKYACVVSIG